MAKSERSKFCDFSRKERQIIYERDNNMCRCCGSTSMLEIAHAYLPRSKGGAGNRFNGVLLCKNCHQALDSYGANKRYLAVKRVVVRRLEKFYGPVDLKKIKYDKYRELGKEDK